ncbi:MAG: TetR/AcrR family transcriptional regulator [Clostridium sp.]|nr:TetR/AcrR family transcriptional regulator [Clostridium sp.]
MGSQRARSKEEVENRQREIIHACAELFKTMDYEEITLKAISESTSMSRTSMYSYYQTKDEVFLDYLKTEYLDWEQELRNRFDAVISMSKEDFCHFLTDSLLRRETMMRLLSVHLTAIEKNCSLDKLVVFKRDVQVVFDTFSYGLKKMFPNASNENLELFQSQFFIFTFGLYPYNHPTQKQLEALLLAGISPVTADTAMLCYKGVLLLATNL